MFAVKKRIKLPKRAYYRGGKPPSPDGSNYFCLCPKDNLRKPVHTEACIRAHLSYEEIKQRAAQRPNVHEEPSDHALAKPSASGRANGSWAFAQRGTTHRNRDLRSNLLKFSGQQAASEYNLKTYRRYYPCDFCGINVSLKLRKVQADKRVGNKKYVGLKCGRHLERHYEL